MRFALIWSGGVSAVLALLLLAGSPLKAADNGDIRPVAETLGARAQTAAPQNEGQKGKLSDSAVRVLMTYAFSLVPDQAKGPDGKTVKVDKSVPNKFLIPLDDARGVIRASTRSAYAEVCGLPELGRANYQTLVKGEQARMVWTPEQIMFIKSLHHFSVSYFTGNIQINDAPAEPGATSAANPPEAGAPAPATPDAATAPPAASDAEQSKAAAAAEPSTEPAFTPKKPECSPEQKQKVTQAINAYVQSASAAPAGDAKAAPGAN